MLSNLTFGNVYHLNYPQRLPRNIDFTQHFIAPLGDIISIELQGVRFFDDGCEENSTIEVKQRKMSVKIPNDNAFSFRFMIIMLTEAELLGNYVK